MKGVLRHHSRFIQLQIQNTTRGAKLQAVFDINIKEKNKSQRIINLPLLPKCLKFHGDQYVGTFLSGQKSWGRGQVTLKVT